MMGGGSFGRALAALALLLAFVLASMLVESRACAQAWTREQGHFYANLSLRALAADKVYGPDFVARPIASTYRQYSLGIYGEVGLVSRWLTASVSSELLRHNSLEGQGATYGLGDTRVGLFSGLLVAPFRLTVGLLAGLPTGDSTPHAEQGADPIAETIARTLPTGDGEADVEAQVIGGYGFGSGRWPLRHYVTASVGYWLRTRGISDSITYRIETGARIERPTVDRFILILRVVGVESFANSREAALGFVGLGQGVSYTAFGAELGFRILENLGVGFGIETAIRARSIAAAPVLKFSISVER